MVEQIKNIMVGSGATWVLWLLFTLSVASIAIMVDRARVVWWLTVRKKANIALSVAAALTLSACSSEPMHRFWLTSWFDSRGFDWLMRSMLALLGCRYVCLFVAAVLHRSGRPAPPSDARPRVTAIIPAHNEEMVIAGSIRSLAASDWKDLEILVIDDGSTDGTLARALASVPEVPNLRVIAQTPNLGKPAALNRGLAEATGEIVVTLDADTLFEPDAIRRLVAPFDDPRVAAISGNLKVGNREDWLGVWQSLEYVIGLNVERRAQSWINCVTTVPGAAGAYRRTALLAAGGFSSDTLTEDTDLTLTLLGMGWHVRYEDRAIARTEAPATVRALYGQRLRWLQGNLQCAWKHRRSFLTGPWRLRVFGIPNFWFTHLGSYLLLPLSVVAFLHRVPERLVEGIALYVAIDVLVAAVAYAMDGERRRELVHSPLQRVLWPFFLSAVFVAVVMRLMSGKSEWTRIPRTGALLSR